MCGCGRGMRQTEIKKMTRDIDGETGDGKKRPLQVSMTYSLHCLCVNTAVCLIRVSATSLQISMPFSDSGHSDWLIRQILSR